MYRLCMKGNIYTSQRCPSCGGVMRHDDRRHNCVCSSCDIGATGGYRVKFGREISRRFTNYPEAAQFLSGLRFKTAEGSLDKRDYQADQPMAFSNQADKWLAIKKKQVCMDTYRVLHRYIQRACAAWGHRNVRTITTGDIEDFLFDDKTARSDKTRADIRSCINQFFTWLEDREGFKKPRIPKIEYELGWRKITDLETQQAILAELDRIAPLKVAFAIELLATYPKLRPDDLRRICEGDYRDGIITIHNPTKRKNAFKILQLLPVHTESWGILKKRYPALPNVKFFRHHHVSGIKNGTPFGKDVLYKWWKKACDNLGIEGLDLYGGTRHTTTTAIATLAGEANAKKASGHLTNKAFERYCQAEDQTAFEMAKLVRKKTGQQVANLKNKKKPAK